MAETPEGLDAPTPEPTPDQPADDAPTPARKPAKKTTRSKLRLSREQWIVAVLLVLTLELGLRAALGSWKRTAAAHLIIGAIVLVILIVRAALQAATNRTAKTGTDTSGTGRRSRIPGLSRILGRNGTPNTNGTTGPSRSRNPFGNLLGGKRPGGDGSPGGHSRNPLRNLFSWKRPGGGGHGPAGSGGRRSPFGGRGTNPTGGARRNPFSGLFGRNRPGGAPRGGGERRSPFGGLFGGRPDQPGRDKKPPNDKGGKPDKPEKQPKDKTGKPDDSKKPDPDQPAGDKPDDQNPTGDTEPQREPTEKGEPPMAQAQTPNQGIGAPKGASLHAWGRTLPKIGEALDDLKRRYKLLEVEADALLSDVTLLATLGETEQVRNTRGVVGQLQAIAADLRSIGTRPTSEAIAKVSGKSSVLWPTYLRDCGADEDRVSGKRGTRRQERNADVRTAEQDI